MLILPHIVATAIMNLTKFADDLNGIALVAFVIWAPILLLAVLIMLGCIHWKNSIFGPHSKTNYGSMLIW